jgi:hypothetical protein
LCVIGSVLISLLIPEFIRYQATAGIEQKELEEAMRETETKNLLVE